MKGGRKKGAGRPLGSMNEDTALRMRAEAEYRRRVVKLTNTLLNKQLQLAKGCSYLYRIDKDEKGKKMKPVLVTDRFEIQSYLEGEYEEEDQYYYITTEKPDLKAMQDMLDRTYGKAINRTDLTTDGEALQIQVKFI